MIAAIVATALIAGSLGILIGSWLHRGEIREVRDELRCERAAHEITRRELRHAESRLAWNTGLGGGAA